MFPKSALQRAEAPKAEASCAVDGSIKSVKVWGAQPGHNDSSLLDLVRMKRAFRTAAIPALTT